ncbi:hypothetical protein [Salsipaludibacter albus]|uniref:hypothetical protein n=1 Tax=Salsipaludibacter albus TaxID=2849650 RepID=UPI001EE49B05|nr:hypothetical protein [Salsipaludibacter albus]MBY5162419.1 hypothetical protein [Salsipaludibacter albus]
MGDQTHAVYEQVHSRTSAWTGEIQEMTARLRTDFEHFTEEVQAEAARLESVGGATNWQGRSGAAARERLAELRAHATAFRDRAMADVETFRTALEQLVERHYDHIGTEMRATVEAMQQANEAEAAQAAGYARAARELDESAAL